ncbi:MAG TPA: acyl carrier protein [Terriglobales bacterium]|nr:acyl carrier protein [Terriglobales bacterium]
MKKIIFDRVRGIASDLLDVPVEEIRADSSPENLEPWSSILHLNLVLAIEEDFKVQFSPEDMEQMNTIERIVNIVENKLQAEPS